MGILRGSFLQKRPIYSGYMHLLYPEAIELERSRFPFLPYQDALSPSLENLMIQEHIIQFGMMGRLLLLRYKLICTNQLVRHQWY